SEYLRSARGYADCSASAFDAEPKEGRMKPNEQMSKDVKTVREGADLSNTAMMLDGESGILPIVEGPALISRDLTKAFNTQIGHEYGASLQYVSIAGHFEQLHLPVLSHLFFTQADEERQHALKFVKYVLNVKGDLQIPQIAAPSTSFASAQEAVAAALK